MKNFLFIYALIFVADLSFFLHDLQGVKLINIVWGVAQRRGHRKCMEDYYLISQNIDDKDDRHLFGVFDGHAGDEAAKYTVDNLMSNINPEISPEKALIEAFEKTDKDFRKKNPDEIAGTTALVAWFVGNSIYFAWSGDSRGYLIDDTHDIIFKTKDHKPDDKKEFERIKNGGGSVYQKRVNGELAVSRGIGDALYKRGSKRFSNISSDLVIATPEVKKIVLTGSEKYIVLASDGVWDVVDDRCLLKEITKAEGKNEYSNKKIKQKEFSLCEGTESKIKYMARRLRDKAYDKGSTDNLSVIVVKLVFEDDSDQNSEITNNGFPNIFCNECCIIF